MNAPEVNLQACIMYGLDSYTMAQWLEHHRPRANIPGSSPDGGSQFFFKPFPFPFTQLVIILNLCVCIFAAVVDNCMSTPCQNEGTCTSGVGTFSCQCTAGFTGDTCQTGERHDDERAHYSVPPPPSTPSPILPLLPVSPFSPLLAPSPLPFSPFSSPPSCLFSPSLLPLLTPFLPLLPFSSPPSCPFSPSLLPLLPSPGLVCVEWVLSLLYHYAYVNRRMSVSARKNCQWILERFAERTFARIFATIPANVRAKFVFCMIFRSKNCTRALRDHICLRNRLSELHPTENLFAASGGTLTRPEMRAL